MNLQEKAQTYQPVKGRFYIRKLDNLVVRVKDITVKELPGGPAIVFTLGDCFAALLEETEESFLNNYQKLH